MMRRSKLIPLAAAAFLAVTALAACSSGGGGSGGANSQIIACGDLALSGPYAQIGQTDNWGATAYFDYINSHGGILGHQVKYFNLNNQSNAANSELNAKKCIQTYHANVIIGPESGADTESAMPIAIANKTVLISLSSGWQSNGYPASQLNSYGFPGFYDVFYQDQYDSVQNLIVPRHYQRVALIENDCGPVCLANQGTVQALAKQYGFQLVSTQIAPLAATDVTPQVTNLLAAKPDIILFGLVPGTPSITAIRAIRTQDPDIPGSMSQWLDKAKQGTSDQAKATAAGLQQYMDGMKGAGLSKEDQIDNSQEGWDAGLEINWAMTQAGTVTDETKIMQKLQHLNINTLGIVWNRTPDNYENISQVLSAMEVINSDGSATLFK
jgi:ABC-type branched-subunit amino acid transport system substrate-binding protein